MSDVDKTPETDAVWRDSSGCGFEASALRHLCRQLEVERDAALALVKKRECETARILETVYPKP